MPLSTPPGPFFPGGRASPVTYWPPATFGATSAVGAITAGRIGYVPARWPGVTIDRLQIEVTTGAAGGCRLGIYTNNNGLPGSLIMEGTTVDTTSIAIVASTITSFTFPEDWVWYCYTMDAGPTCRIGTPRTEGNPLGLESNQTPRRGLLVTRAYGALPAAADLTSVAFGGNMPIIVGYKA
jgi:hypothetical protein